MRELFEALVYEDAFGLASRSQPAPPADVPADPAPGPGERWLRLPLGEGGALVFRARQRPWLHPFRLAGLPVLARDRGDATWTSIGPVELIRRLAGTVPEAERPCQLPGLDAFVEDLRAAIEGVALARADEEAARAPFRGAGVPPLAAWEWLSALRDRPFHPTARVKRGWSPEDAKRYGPGRTFGLAWIAVRRDALLHAPAAEGAEISPALLSPGERARLDEAFAAAGLDAAEHLAVPAHPWQLERVLTRLFADELARRLCVPLVASLGRFTATASLRTLEPAGGGAVHVKLPLGIEALGAVRSLPPRYLHNGVEAQRVLERLRGLDPVLGRRLLLCGEERWWVGRDPAGDLLADKPAHLGCLLRVYPEVDGDTRLVPLAALPVITADGEAPGLDVLLRIRGGATAARALDLFRELAGVVTEVGLRCCRFGVMPELHGQNALLVVRGGRAEGVLLRDHDTLRLHAPWLERHGVAAPRYLIKPGTPNSLTLGTPGELLGYFQMLGVEVALLAVADAIERAYGVELRALLRAMREGVEQCLGGMDAEPDVRDLLERQLLRSERWPSRHVLLPLLRRQGAAGTGMPSATGGTRSPFIGLDAPGGGEAP